MPRNRSWRPCCPGGSPGPCRWRQRRRVLTPSLLPRARFQSCARPFLTASPRSREQAINSRRQKPARPEGTTGEVLAPFAALTEKTTVHDAPHGRPRAASTGLELVNDHHRYLLSTAPTPTSGNKTLS